MEYEKKEASGDDALSVSYDIKLSAENARQMVDEIYAFLAMQTGVDYVANGPKEALLKRFGDDLGQRVAMCLANQCADKVIALEGLPAALEPEVISALPPVEGQEFECTVTIYLKPQESLSSYDAVTLPFDRPCVTDEQIDQEMTLLMERYSRYVDDEEATVVDDTTVNVISIDTRKCGMPVAALTYDNMVCRLGDQHFPPQVEDELRGMACGEEKKFSFTVTSKNFLSLDVQETMDCVLRLDRLVKKDIPDLTDGWVRDHIPGAHSVEGFREQVRKNLNDRAQSSYLRAAEDAAVTALAARLPELELPEMHYDYARAGLLQNVSAALSRQGMATDELLTAQGLDQTRFMLQMSLRAKNVVLQGLALDALARHEGMEATEEDILYALRAISPGKEDEARKMLEMNGRTYQLREMALRAKARKYLIEYLVA